MTNDLTEKQAKLLAFIEQYQWKHGSSPTLREMREKFKVSSDNSILKHLNALQEKGRIQRDDTPRGIKLLDKIRNQLDAAANIINVPLLGAIPAGGPVMAEENILGTFEMGKGLMNVGDGYFLLKVTGSSMINAGIHEGDMVLVDPEGNPRDNDIVVALVDGENTVKRYKKDKGGRFYLHPENPEYEDIYPTQALEIQGVVTGLVRNY